MLSAALHEAAADFGRALCRAPAVAAYRDTADALDADPVARHLLADLHEQQTAIGRLQQAGLAPSQVQVNALRLCQAEVRSNEKIMAHLRATNALKAFLPSVAAQVGAVLGIDYAALVAPSSC